MNDLDSGSDTIDYPDLRIEDFHFDMDLVAVEKALGQEEVVPIDFVSDLFRQEDVQSYQAGKTIFTIEQDRLTYMQTLGAKR